MARRALARSSLLIGRCIAHDLKGAARVRIKQLDFDENLHMYFPSYQNYYAEDSDQRCKTGDIVLIRELEQRKTKLVTHSIEKIVYKYGDVTDPITGKKVVMSQYRDHVKQRNEMFGVAEDGTGGFKYDGAPDRGWQEGEKDFSHKVGYQKWHEFEPGHPLHDDPTAC